MLAFIGSFWDWLVVLGITLLVFGHRLPSVMRSLGLSLGEFKKGLKEGTDANQAGALPQSPVAAPPQQQQQMLVSPPGGLNTSNTPVPKQMP